VSIPFLGTARPVLPAKGEVQDCDGVAAFSARDEKPGHPVPRAGRSRQMSMIAGSIMAIIDTGGVGAWGENPPATRLDKIFSMLRTDFFSLWFCPSIVCTSSNLGAGEDA